MPANSHSTNRLSFYDRLCEGSRDPSLPEIFHVPLQQYALSGIETDRILTDLEQEAWRLNILVSYVLGKRSGAFFSDPAIPAFLSPALMDWLNTVEERKAGYPITRFMRLLNRFLSPYDRFYDFDNPRSVRRFLTDMATLYDVSSGLPAPLRTQDIFELLAQDAQGLPVPAGQSFPLSRGMAHIWRHLLKNTVFDPANRVARADFLIHFFRLFEATTLDQRLIPAALVTYLGQIRYPATMTGSGITNLMVEIFYLAGLEEQEGWKDPTFAQTMATQFFSDAYANLLLPDDLVQAHDAMAQRLGLFQPRRPYGQVKVKRWDEKHIWKKPDVVSPDASVAHINFVTCDDADGQTAVPMQALIAMAQKAGVRGLVLPSIQDLRRRNLERVKTAEEKPLAPMNLFTCPLDRLGDFVLRRGIDVFEGRTNIAYASWGTDRLPRIYKVALGLLDEIWVPSQAQKMIFEKDTNVPVVVMPRPVQLPAPSPTITRGHLELPEKHFLFLTVVDAADWLSRKNPIAVLQAFQLAFPKDEKVGLIIKTRNFARTVATREEGHFARMQKIWRIDQRLFTIHDDYSASEMAGLYALADAYVSLPRASAFDTALANAMVMGKPVVASEGGGHSDYLNTQNAYLVPAEPCSVVFDAYHYLDKEVGHRWMDPDIESAAKAMRAIYEQPAAAKARGVAGQKTVQELYSLDACAARLRTRVETLLKERGS